MGVGMETAAAIYVRRSAMGDCQNLSAAAPALVPSPFTTWPTPGGEVRPPVG